MTRFRSFEQVPAETRAILRLRFSRALKNRPQPFARYDKSEVIDDEQLLKLLLGTTRLASNDWELAKATYEGNAAPIPDAPTFEDLAKTGWIRRFGRRFKVSWKVAQIAEASNGPIKDVLFPILNTRNDHRFRFSDLLRDDASLAQIVTRLQNEDLKFEQLGCRAPDWVAARLWDRGRSNDPHSDLDHWLDRVRLLGPIQLTPARAWSPAAREQFQAVTLESIASPETFLPWSEFRTALVSQTALIHGEPVSEMDRRIPRLPETVLSRYLWLHHGTIRHRLGDSFELGERLLLPVHTLLNDVRKDEAGPAPHPTARDIFAVAVERPELLFAIDFSLCRSPELLVDLLLYPATSIVACLIISQWRVNGGAYEHVLVESDAEDSIVEAFIDAASILSTHLRRGHVPPSEVAALLSMLHLYASHKDTQGQTHLRNEKLLRALKAELSEHSFETLSGLYQALIYPEQFVPIQRADLATALDVIDLGALNQKVEPEPVVRSYLGLLAMSDTSSQIEAVTPRGAAMLVQQGLQLSACHRNRFFMPVDVSTLRPDRDTDGVGKVSEGEAARQLRLHILVLCRALRGWSGPQPQELVQATLKALTCGSHSQPGSGRVSAFSSSFEVSTFRGTHHIAMADELAACLNVLVAPEREEFIQRILEIDEPLVLAKLSELIPEADKGRVRDRLAQLSPDRAGAVTSYPQAVARIEALISADQFDAAAAYMEQEAQLQTLGNVPGRAEGRLRMHLRVLLGRQDWTAIESMSLPDNIPNNEEQSAQQLLLFFKGVSALLKPAGNPEYARNIFRDLVKARGNITAYSVNYFAARSTILLRNDVFVKLVGADLIEARQAISDADVVVKRIGSSTPGDEEIYLLHRARLSLAIGAPSDALESLQRLEPARRRAEVMAFTAVALSRMHRDVEAVAILDDAGRLYGEAGIVQAARSQIRAAAPFVAPIPVAEPDDPRERLKAAFNELRNSGPIDQSAVLTNPSKPFEEFLTDQVRRAASRLPGLPLNLRKENDVTKILQELLLAQGLLCNWFWSDQSEGGTTAAGNRGERDLTLYCGGTEMAIVEAVLLRNPPHQEFALGELISHFQRLFSYSQCEIYFHVTYAAIVDTGSVLPVLEGIAGHQAPPGFEYIGRLPLPASGSLPPGMVARYRASIGERKVVFLVVDVGLTTQLEAAKTSSKSNPRNKLAGKKRASASKSH